MRTKISVLFFFLLGISLYAQDRTITGTVTSSEDGLPIPSANIVIKGTSNGTSTDFDGNYTINANQGDVLEFSYIGFKTVDVTIDSQSNIDIAMETQVSDLEEVVIVGYGSQKKSDLTGAIATVDSEVIEKTPNSNVMQSLQGKVPGVQITSAGSPGDSPNVRIRGVNTINGSQNPLYVVDGNWYDNIDFLDNSQIENVSVLKDVSSTAIFGQRGSNGVIIIKTKGGKKGRKSVITYNGYTGIQHAQNVLKMANAEQFVTMVYESGSAADIQYVENAIQRFGRSRINPNIPNVNTDWYREVLRDAPITNHSLGVTGGGENSNYGINTSYFSQEGILDMKNEYERFNIQANLDIDVSDRFKIGVNSAFSNATKYNPENGAWFQAYFAVPILPKYDYANTGADPIPFSDATLLDYRGSQNPFPAMTFNDNQLRIRKLLTSIYAEYYLIPDKLSFKTTYYNDYSTILERNVYLPYFISGQSQRQVSSIRRANLTTSNQMWDNLLTYSDTFGKHALKVIGGTSFRDLHTNSFSATGDDIRAVDFESSWYLNFADKDSFNGRVFESADRFYYMSYLGRLEYSFDDKYLFNATVRREGDSKFPRQIWKTTPQLGLGWVISNEKFLSDNNYIDFLKLRATWGQLANGSLSGSSGTNTINTIVTAIDDTQTGGIIGSSTFQNLKREIMEETNFGISARLFNSRLSLEADYYIRDIKDLVASREVPITGNFVFDNIGEMRNKGFEFAANWNQTINDNWKFSIGGNFATLDNEVTKLDNGREYIDTGSAEFRQRIQVGEPINHFFGLEVAGVYQNNTEVANDPIAVDNGLVPGDFKYVDQNNDGIIDDNDRVNIGSYLPTFNYGANIKVSYKNFDLSIDMQGQSGNQILNRKRGEVIFTNDTNMDADFAINRWHGEGTTNSYPSAAGRRKAWNQKMSSFFIEDGAYFRIQNIQLAYTIKAGTLLGDNMPETRVYFTADRPFTFFNYNGFNPEVANGVDRQTYPVPAVYTVGVNVKI